MLAGLRVACGAESQATIAACRLLRDLGAEMVPAQAHVVVGAASPSASTVVHVRIDGDGGPSPLYGAEAAAELTGAHAAVAALAALRHVRATGSHVDVHVEYDEVVASCLGEHLPARICRRAAASPRDTRPFIVRCADGHVGVAVPTDEDALALFTLTGAVPHDREALGSALACLRRDEFVEDAQLWRLPVVPALDAAEAQSLRNVLGAAGRSPLRIVSTRDDGTAEPSPRGPQPLSGVLVLDLGMIWAGPWCGRLLAGLGATVVKVEGPSRPDGTRGVEGHCTGVFGDLNRGKFGLVIDLGRDEGRAAFLRLALRADVVVENFSPRVLPNFGLAPLLLAEENPRLVVLSMPAFPSHGRWSAYVAYGGGIELAAGLAPRDAQGVPQPAAVPYLDYLSGCHGAAAVLAALHARDLRGHGTVIELAQWALATSVLDANGGRPVSQPDDRLDVLLARPALLRGALVRGGNGHPCSHYRRLPFKVSGIPVRRERSAPGFGSDSARVLERHAGLAPDVVARLVAEHVVVESSA
jgi:crotonobetainyl-CoA:carnitine CoA-transferase CaiB-like acyl-CoA transferase